MCLFKIRALSHGSLSKMGCPVCCKSVVVFFLLFKNVDRGETPVLGKSPCNGFAGVPHQMCSVYPCLGSQMQPGRVGAGKEHFVLWHLLVV